MLYLFVLNGTAVHGSAFVLLMLSFVSDKSIVFLNNNNTVR